MLKLVTDDWTLGYVKDDPVRPHLPMHWRTTNGREVFVLESDNKIRAVLCVSYTNGIAVNEDSLNNTVNPDTAMFYTVWSYDKGAGREIIFDAVKSIQEKKPYIKRFCTLSPVTEIAEKFHLRNGAKLLAKYDNYQNFEYKFVNGKLQVA